MKDSARGEGAGGAVVMRVPSRASMWDWRGAAVAVLLWFVLAACVEDPGSAAGTSQIVEFTAAGIPVVLKPVHANEVIALRLYLKGGSANLTPESAGIENFIAAVSERGTQRYSRDEFAARSAATGTVIGGEVNPDYTVTSVQAVSEHWEAAWDLFAQAVRYPTFPDAEVELVRGQILNQLRARVDNPDAYLAVQANALLYDGHPYAIDPFGMLETVQAMTVDDLRAWHAERLTKENLLVVAVGNVTQADLTEKIESAFGELPASGGAAGEIPQLAPSPAAVQVTERELPTNYIRGQFVAPDPGHPDYPAMRLAIELLNDRLFEEVRTKRNLSYAVGVGLSQRRSNYGILYVTPVEPDTTLAVILAELDRLKNEPLSAARLGQSANVYLTQYYLGQETNMLQATTLGTFELVGGGWEGAEAFGERIRAVTPEEIQRVARTYLTGLHIAVIGDPEAVNSELFTSY
ncbi:MAG: pitrilysin family protein [Gemmatimonadota bacterium]